MIRNLVLIFGLLLVLTIDNVSKACTSIYIAKDSLILAGKNQDFGEWRTILKFSPPGNGRFGKAFFGGKGVFPTGGINSEGLFFELHQGEFRKKFSNAYGKNVYPGNLIDKIMSECSTVQNVIDTLKRYTQEFLFNQNIAFGDKLGNSIILEGDTIITRQGYYQICTNFYQSIYNRFDAPCWRYKNVEEKIKGSSELSVNLIREALRSAQNSIFTQYSVVYDLKKGIIYVYFYRDFENFKTFNLRDEFQKGEHLYYLPDLFPNNKSYLDTYIKRLTPINNIFIAIFSGLFIILTIASVVFAFWMYISDKESLYKRRISLLTRLTLGFVSVLSMVYLVRFFDDPESLQIGLFHPINNCYSFISLIILHVPKILAILDLAMIALSIHHWKLSMYSLLSRIYFSVYTIFLFVMILLFTYWGFILPK
jgi:hypothetical protein